VPTVNVPGVGPLNFPDGMSDADMSSAIQKNFPQIHRAAEGATLNAMPGIDKFGVGLARPIIRTALGIKQLSGPSVDLNVDEQGGLIGTDSGQPGGLSDQDKAVLQHLSQVKGPAATTGDILGNVAMLAAPGGAVTQFGSVLPKTMAMRGLMMTGADAAANAGTAALAVPEEGQTRGSDAANAALGSVAGSAVGRVLGGIARPAINSIAEKFSNAGIPLTPGQAIGGAGQWIENQAARIPLLGSMIRSRQKDAVSAWNLKLLADTANSVDTGGTGDLVNAAGPKGFAQAKKIFSDAYDFHWDRPLAIDTQSLGNSWGQLAQDAQSSLAPEAGALVQRKLANTLDEIGSITNPSGAVNGSQLQEIDKGLSQSAGDAARAGQGDVAKIFGQAKRTLRDEYPQNFRDSLDALDTKYADFARLRRAGSYVSGPAAGQPFTPSQLLTASTGLDRSAGKQATAQGTAIMQPQAVEALSVFPKGSTGAAPGSLESALNLGGGLGAFGTLAHFAVHPVTAPVVAGIGMGSALYTKPGVRALTGQTGPQQFVRQSPLAQAVSEWLRPAQVGSAVADE
jgi:hypothetical protein